MKIAAAGILAVVVLCAYAERITPTTPAQMVLKRVRPHTLAWTGTAVTTTYAFAVVTSGVVCSTLPTGGMYVVTTTGLAE